MNYVYGMCMCVCIYCIVMYGGRDYLLRSVKSVGRSRSIKTRR